MTLKSITLHRAAIDNADRFVDAGTDLIVGDEPDMIDAHRARDLISSHGGQGHHVEPAEPAKDTNSKKSGKGDD